MLNDKATAMHVLNIAGRIVGKFEATGFTLWTWR